MKIEQLRFYDGPNRHTLHSAIEAIVQLGGYGEYPTNHRPDFTQRLLRLAPGLQDHVCSKGYPGGFVDRLHEGTYLGHVVEHLALELLFLAGEDGHYGKTRQITGTDLVRIVFESGTQPGGAEALSAAVHIIRALWDDRTGDDELAMQVTSVVEAIRGFQFGPSTQAIIEAARARDIPVKRLNDANYLRLGLGAAQRRVMAAMTDQTSVIAADVCQDKGLTKQLLGRQGIPVPVGYVVNSWQQAREAAAHLGYPLVVKPNAGQQGRGVTTGVRSEEELHKAFDWAQQEQSQVLIEEQIFGAPYRVLVVHDRVVAASLRRPPTVEGDGIHTISFLLEEANRDPRRRAEHLGPLSFIGEDEGLWTALAHQDLTLQSIPAAGQVVLLRETANLSSGGDACDVTDELGAEFQEDIVRAVRAIGLDVAGVDVIADDIQKPLTATGGRVIEINAAPGLRMHLYPSQGASRAVGEAIVDALFKGHDGRIPVCAVTGTNGKTTVTRMLAHIWRQTGKIVGATTTDGIMIGDRQIQSGDLTGPWSADVVLGDKTTEVAILETARGGMARYGLGFHDCDVAVVTNIGADHLGQDDIDTLDDLTHLKALIVDVTRPTGACVLNADDLRVASMAHRTKARIVWFSLREDNPIVLDHLASGGEAVVLSRGFLVYRHGTQARRIIGGRALPASWRGRVTFNVQNAMAAAAAALAMGLEPAFIGRSLASFDVGQERQNPGRLELMQGEMVDVLLDYAHNQPALAALGDVVRALGYPHVTTVLGLPGDRRNQDLMHAVQEAQNFSDYLVIREDEDLRGRRPGEMAQLMVETLQNDHISANQWTVVLNEAEAVKQAVTMAPSGSLVVALFEHYEGARQAALEALGTRAQESVKSLA
ncbi:cyanophycin synthetase [Sulfobacillus sp. hq2]|uniref:cyanophycin synthetase n=1 Tax=Sulfobacillus TaxID=28033 RepID=UPI001FA8D7C7|nr:cyanophycin synthetase [Sulfobacillus sp. hq2]